MLDWVGLLLRVVYIYGHFIGVNNFELDWQTGRVFRTPRSTLYAIAVIIIIAILLGFQFTGRASFNVLFGNANQLHENVIIAMTVMRITAGITTVLYRWRQQCQLMTLSRKIIRLLLAKPQVIRMSRWGILVKFIIASVTDFFQIAITLDAIGRVDSSFFLGMGLQFWMSAIFNLAISQHYLVMLLVRAQYQLLNIELRQVVEESKDLSYHQPRKGVFMTRCCYLADRLEDIAKLQNELQSIVTQMDDIFGLQGLMMCGGYYISSVATSYLTYSVFKYGYKNLGMTQRTVNLSLAWCFFFYLDAMLNLFSTLHVLDAHREMIRILEERTLFAIGLDVRLEETFESLQLQLIRNPLKVEVMKLFTITRSSSSTMFGSLITHSIFLIQYDMEYF